jgi:serine/threonine-protein kinase
MAVRPRSSEPVAFDARERIAHYEVLTEIARAPRASLWAAHSSGGADVGRLVALRRVPRESLDAEHLERVRSAGVIAKRIRDPKVVAVLDVVVAPREIAIVNEYIDGEPLRSVQRLAAQRGAALPIPVSMRIALDLLMGARGAAEAYRNASRHAGPKKNGAPSPYGAISPEAAIVASFGETMLTDLALAGIGNSLPAHPSAMRYWAPERFDSTIVLDERSDVFSVGVLLWELIANQPLFGPPRWSHDAFNLDDADADAVMQKVRTAPIARLDANRRAGAPVSSKVADVVARALERDRNARYASADEMIAAIFRLDSAVATPDEVVTALDRVARPILEARRASLGQLTDRLTTRDSAPPESAKGTYRPPAPAASIPPTIPKSPKVPLSMLVMGTASVQKPLRSASFGASNAPPSPVEPRGATHAGSRSAVATVRPSAPARAAVPPEVSLEAARGRAPEVAVPTPSAPPRISALPKVSPPKPVDRSRVPYRAVPPPRASAAPVAPALTSRPPKPPLPARASQRPVVADDVETNRIAPRWQVAPDEPRREGAARPDTLRPEHSAPVAAPAVAAISKPPTAPPPRPISSPPKPGATAEPGSPRAASAPPPPSLQPEHDGKGPFGWAPDDSTHMLDPVGDDLSPRFVTALGIKASLRAVVVGAAAAAALLALVIALSASRQKSDPSAERPSASASTPAATTPPSAPSSDSAATPPATADPGGRAVEAVPPPSPSTTGADPHKHDPPPAESEPSQTAPRPARPGGDRPRPAGNDAQYRPRGI